MQDLTNSEFLGTPKRFPETLAVKGRSKTVATAQCPFAQLLTLEGFGFKELIDDFALPEIASQMQAGMKRYDDAREVKQRKKH